MIIVIQNDQTHLKLEKERQIVQAREDEARKKALKEKIQLINSWSWMVILILGVFSLGVYTGINLIAQGVLCPSRESICYFLRFDGNKKYLQ